MPPSTSGFGLDRIEELNQRRPLRRWQPSEVHRRAVALAIMTQDGVFKRIRLAVMEERELAIHLLRAQAHQRSRSHFKARGSSLRDSIAGGTHVMQ